MNAPRGVRHGNRLCHSLHWNPAKQTRKQRRKQANKQEPSNNQSKQPNNRTTILPNLQTLQRTTSEQPSAPPQYESTVAVPSRLGIRAALAEGAAAQHLVNPLVNQALSEARSHPASWLFSRAGAQENRREWSPVNILHLRNCRKNEACWVTSWIFCRLKDVTLPS